MSDLGGWLFARRGWLPGPLALAAVALARGPGSSLVPGLLVLAAGLLLRLWGVAHIGPRSRTRAAAVGALVDSGPFGYSRNPLYIGNILMWAGVGLLTGRAWVAAAMVAPLLPYYHLIVTWEEGRLSTELGEPYRAYRARVPRWLLGPGSAAPQPGEWREAARSERSTWLAAAVVTAAVLLRGIFLPFA